MMRPGERGSFGSGWYAQVCYKCKEPFAMSQELENVLRRQASRGTFHCPNGHPQCYAEGETEADKLRRERDQLKQQLAHKDDRISELKAAREAAERSASAQKGQVTKLKRRAAAGVCPCCNRTFTNLARHMNTQHPDFTKDETHGH